jgi:hypothetical protein
MFGRFALARAGMVTPVARVDPDQVAAERCDLGFGCGDWLLGHSPIVAGSAAGRHPG